MKNIDCYLLIENKGEIDVNAFKLLGATSKEGQDKIGYFGTGLKYALAVLLRNEMEFQIFSGLKEIKITTVSRKFRGQKFDVIKINGEVTSLTTGMGKDWEPWFAVREVYCNALDETGSVLDVQDEIKPEEGKTKFYIKYDKRISDVFKNWDNYFSEKRTDIVYQDGKNKVFFGGKKLIVYRKGINVFQYKTKCIFNYDMDNVDINESRTIRSDWGFKFELVRWLAMSANEQMIRLLYDNYQNAWEEQLDWKAIAMFNQSWLDVLNGRSIILRNTAGRFTEQMSENTIVLQDDLAFALQDYFKEKIKILGYSSKYGKKTILPTTGVQARVLQECLFFLQSGGVKIPYKVAVCEFHHKAILGEGIEDTIFLSPRLFDMGKKEIVATLIEEYAHLDSGAGDNTRSFQNYLIKKFIGSIEQKTNTYL